MTHAGKSHGTSGRETTSDLEHGETIAHTRDLSHSGDNRHER